MKRILYSFLFILSLHSFCYASIGQLPLVDCDNVEELQDVESRHSNRKKLKAENRRDQSTSTCKDELIAKYGQRYGEIIFKGGVDLGMSREMALASWGEPSEKSVSSDGEHWLYYSEGYTPVLIGTLIFRDDKLIEYYENRDIFR